MLSHVSVDNCSEKRQSVVLMPLRWTTHANDSHIQPIKFILATPQLCREWVRE